MSSLFLSARSLVLVVLGLVLVHRLLGALDQLLLGTGLDSACILDILISTVLAQVVVCFGIFHLLARRLCLLPYTSVGQRQSTEVFRIFLRLGRHVVKTHENRCASKQIQVVAFSH